MKTLNDIDSKSMNHKTQAIKEMTAEILLTLTSKKNR
jgi:hypothetical protein